MAADNLREENLRGAKFSRGEPRAHAAQLPLFRRASVIPLGVNWGRTSIGVAPLSKTLLRPQRITNQRFFAWTTAEMNSQDVTI
jgi:hypothetical protein